MTVHPAPPPEPPAENPYINFPDWLLADTMGDLHAKGEVVAEQLKLAKAEMDRRKRRSLDGTRFAVSKSVERIKRFDSDGVKRKFGQAWWDGWCKSGTRKKWTFTELPPAEVGR